MNDLILTIRNIAQALKLTEKTVYAMATEGEIPAFKVRGQWRVRRVDLDEWLSRQTSTPTLPVLEEVKAAPKSEIPQMPGDGRPVKDLTVRISQEEMHRRLVAALGAPSVRTHAPWESKPFEMDLAAPLPQRVRVYMYNATRPPGGRPLGEHKIQLIAPGQRRGERASFDNGAGRIVLLIGYGAEEEVFILWDAGLYTDFAWSRNVQVKAETIIQATAGKLATQERQLRARDGKPTLETVLVAKPRRLGEAIIRRMELTRERLTRD